jgi:hypothetical protein
MGKFLDKARIPVKLQSKEIVGQADSKGWSENQWMREVMAYQAGKTCSASPEIISNWIDEDHNKLLRLAVSYNNQHRSDRA